MLYGKHKKRAAFAALFAAVTVIFAACGNETNQDGAGLYTADSAVTVGDKKYKMQGYTYLETTGSGVLYSEGVKKTRTPLYNADGSIQKYADITSLADGYEEAWAIDFVKPDYTVTSKNDDSNRFWHFTPDKTGGTVKKRYFMMPGTEITGTVSETDIALKITGTIQADDDASDTKKVSLVIKSL